MKKFENKETGFTTADKNNKIINMGFAGMAIQCLNNPPAEGWDKNNIEKSLRVESALKKVSYKTNLDNGQGGLVEVDINYSTMKLKEKVDLEDADFDYLYMRAQPQNMKWREKSQDIVDFGNYLDKLKE
jgi:hypothetical protein